LSLEFHLFSELLNAMIVNSNAIYISPHNILTLLLNVDEWLDSRLH